MNSILFLTISIVFHLSFTNGAIEWGYDTLYGNAGCTGSLIAYQAIQSGNCYSFSAGTSTQVTCAAGGGSAIELECGSDNCATGTCTSTSFTAGQCNATTMSIGTCAAGLPSFTGMAVFSEYTAGNCNGVPATVAAYVTGVCFYGSIYTCSGQNVTVNSYEAEDCSGTAIQTTTLTGCAAADGVGIFYGCGTANGVQSTTGSTPSGASSIVSNFCQVLPILLVAIAFL